MNIVKRTNDGGSHLDSRIIFFIFLVAISNILIEVTKSTFSENMKEDAQAAEIDAMDEIEPLDQVEQYVEEFEEDEFSLPENHFIRGSIVYKKASYSDDYDLYLLNKAKKHIPNRVELLQFRNKVIDISEKLDIEPSWLMAVMYTESRFDTRIKNARGSGATGLIQWMPSTLKGDKYGMTTSELADLSHLQQLDLVYRYLSQVQRAHGKFDNLTETYIAVVRPATLDTKDDMCSILFEKGTRKYKLNSVLDLNGDGLVTISDIDKKMQSMYHTAYFRKPYEFVATVRSMKGNNS